MKKFFFSATVCTRRFSSAVPALPPCDFKPEQYEGNDYDTNVEIRKKHVAPCITALYRKPLLIHQGHMQWLFDHEGKRYLDMFGGIVTVSVGHCHPKVVDVTTKQLKKLWHTSNIYMHPNIHTFAEKITSKFPGDLKVAYFVNSGSEANDLAILLARMYTGNYDIISLRNSYHGMSSQTMGLTALNTWRFNVPAHSGIHHAMNPDPYKGLWGGSKCRDSPIQPDRKCDCQGNDCYASDMYYQQLQEIFKYSLPKGKLAGMFAESIQGVGGAMQFTKNYIKKAHALVKEGGGVFIADEVQTGFGRTGDHFWGFESHGITPDIVTMAKGIGNGFPLAAVVTTPEIAKSLTKALHFNTFGGNPVACAVGNAVLDIIEEEKLQENCKTVGTYFLQKLFELKKDFPWIGDVRGKGLMIGVELIQNEHREPLQPESVIDILEKCKEMGLLVGRGGLYGNVLRIKPPMCIAKEDVDFTVSVIKEALR